MAVKNPKGVKAGNVRAIHESPLQRNRWLYAAVAGLITFIVLYPLLSNDFLSWDDPMFVLQNPNIYSLSLANIRSMFGSYTQLGQYCPLAQVSWAIDFRLAGGFHPMMFHLTNLLLHLASTIMVFFLVYHLCNRQLPAAFVASLLFGIHPMHLESVAWISERRDVLYSFFYLSGLLAYIQFTIHSRQQFRDTIKWYLLSLVFFILSMFSKGQAVTFPVAVMFIDYILISPASSNFSKFNMKVLLEKIPFFAVALIFGFVALLANKATRIADIMHLPGYYPLFTGFYGLLLYLLKAIVPFHLTVHEPYPISIHEAAPLVFYAAPAILLVFTILVFKKWRTDKYIIGGLLFFLFTIFPVLQFITISETIIMDRYTYIPYIGLFLIAGHVTANPGKYFPLNMKYLVWAVVPLWLITLCVITRDREKVWRDPVSFWTDAIEKCPNNKFAYNNRGSMYLEFNKYEEAFSDFNKGIAIDTTFGRLFVNRGICYAHFKKYDLAINDYNKGIRYDTELYQPYVNRGNIEMDVEHQYEKAIDDYKTAFRKNPDIELLIQTGKAYYQMNDYKNAISQYNKFLDASPNDARALYQRALAEAGEKDYAAAAADAQHARQLGLAVNKNVIQQWEAQK